MLDAVMQDVCYAVRALLKALPVSHPEQLLQVTTGEDAYFSNPIWEQLRDRQDVFSGIFTVWLADALTSMPGRGALRHGNVASGQFFETLGLRAMLGRTFNWADDRRGCP